MGDSKIKVLGLVLQGNHKKHTLWNTKYVSIICICKVISKRTYDLQKASGHIHCALVANTQLLLWYRIFFGMDSICTKETIKALKLEFSWYCEMLYVFPST